MRMPFVEFITNGDLKFVILFISFTSISIYHFVKKIKVRNIEANERLITFHNSKVNMSAFWILISSVFSLLLGLMHSFYFIGKAGGINPSIIFLGVANALITPVLGICLFIICKILRGTFNLKTIKT